MSTTSTAALAAGAPRPSDGGRDLRIGEPQRIPTGPNNSNGWAAAGQGGGEPPAAVASMPSAPSNNGATLRRPEPAGGDTLARPDPMQQPPGALLTVGARSGVYEQAMAQLRARGISWLRLELTESGEWQLICFVPSRQNPNVRRKYEAVARSEVEAIQLVLEKMDRDG